MASLRDKLATAVRLFARPISFVTECPNCGKVHICYASGRRGKAREAISAGGYDRQRGLFTCQICRHRYFVGLLLWPVGKGGPPAIPRDHVPNPRQLVQLRARASGWWMDGSKGIRPDGTNVTSDCTCAPGTSQTNAADPACPIHGEGGEPYHPPPIEFDPDDDPEGDD